jgi:hypothetical protein
MSGCMGADLFMEKVTDDCGLIRCLLFGLLVHVFMLLFAIDYIRVLFKGLDSLLVEGIPECNVSTAPDDTGKQPAVTFNNVVVASIEYRLPPEHKVHRYKGTSVIILLYFYHPNEL